MAKSRPRAACSNVTPIGDVDQAGFALGLGGVLAGFAHDGPVGVANGAAHAVTRLDRGDGAPDGFDRTGKGVAGARRHARHGPGLAGLGGRREGVGDVGAAVDRDFGTGAHRAGYGAEQHLVGL